jgi:hypothetical protein
LQVKRHALEQGTTIKALIESGLRHTLAQPVFTDKRTRFVFPVITTMSRLPNQGIAEEVNTLIDEIRDERLSSFWQT